MLKLLHTKRGFTILELLVVFSVIGLLTGVGFASFASFSKRQVLDQAVSDLKTGIEQARFNAVSRVKPDVFPCQTSSLDRYRLQICTGSDTGKTSCSGANNLYEIDAGCGTGASVQFTSVLNSKKRPSSLTATINPGECGPNGYLQFSVLSGVDTQCRVVLTDGNTSKTLCVDSGGNTSLSDGAVACLAGSLVLTPTLPGNPVVATNTPTATPQIAPTATPTLTPTPKDVVDCLSQGSFCKDNSQCCSFSCLMGNGGIVCQ